MPFNIEQKYKVSILNLKLAEKSKMIAAKKVFLFVSEKIPIHFVGQKTYT